MQLVLSLQISVVRDALQRDRAGVAIRPCYLDDGIGVHPVTQIQRRNGFKAELGEGSQQCREDKEILRQNEGPGEQRVALDLLLETVSVAVVHMQTHADHRVGLFVTLVRFVYNAT